MNIFLRQELLDPQMAPVVGRCKCCGGEIYSRDEAERYGGMCEECCLVSEGEEEEDG